MSGMSGITTTHNLTHKSEKKSTKQTNRRDLWNHSTYTLNLMTTHLNPRSLSLEQRRKGEFAIGHTRTPDVKLVFMKDEYYNIRSTKTFYDAYVFRSRLEARWAVYFNVLGVRYNYEPFSFDDLPSIAPRRKYTPDFGIEDEYSKTKFWLEIKPKYPTKESIDLMEHVFNLENCETPCMILYGAEIPALVEHTEEYGLSDGIGIIEFNWFFDEDIQSPVPDMQEFPCIFPTFKRGIEEVHEALENARNFDFNYSYIRPQERKNWLKSPRGDYLVNRCETILKALNLPAEPRDVFNLALSILVDSKDIPPLVYQPLSRLYWLEKELGFDSQGNLLCLERGENSELFVDLIMNLLGVKPWLHPVPTEPYLQASADVNIELKTLLDWI